MINFEFQNYETVCLCLCFWTCFEDIVLEPRTQDGATNDVDNKGQSRATYHHMTQISEYA